MKKIFIICLGLIAAVSGFGQFVVPIVEEAPYVYIIDSGMSFTEGVIIPDGATLLLEESDDFRFGEGTGITVENGGRLMVQNATVGAIDDSWEGINIFPDPTSDFEEVQAVIMENSVIKDAEKAIEHVLMPSAKMRNVFARNITFVDNYQDISGGALPNDHSNNEAVYGTVYDNCSFTRNSGVSGSTWPIILYSPANYKFKDCFFDFNGNIQVGIHSDYPNNLVLDGCEFNRTGEMGIALHYSVQDVQVVNCRFENGNRGAYGLAPWQDGTTSYEYIGIGLGGHAATTVKNCLIQNNTFVNDLSVNNDCGIYVFPNNELEAYAEGVMIEENSFTNFGTGTYVRECMLGESEITRNGFFDCYKGIIIDEKNYALKLTCNTFVNGHTAIEISENGELQAHDTFISNNHFINAYYDINNLSSTVFEYAIPGGIAVNQPESVFNVDLITNNILKEACQPKNWKSKHRGQMSSNEAENKQPDESLVSFEVYPNPASRILNIQVSEVTSSSARFRLVDVSGKVVYNFMSGENSTEIIDVSHLAPGVYFVIMDNGIEQELKKVVLQ